MPSALSMNEKVIPDSCWKTLNDRGQRSSAMVPMRPLSLLSDLVAKLAEKENNIECLTNKDQIIL